MTRSNFIPPLVGLIKLCSPSLFEQYSGRFPYLVIALFVFIEVSCAKQGFPPGGPSDDIPPYLVNSTPVSQATNVSKTEPIIFEFSEPMDTKSVEDNLVIIPVTSLLPDYEWKSKDRVLTLNFAQPLRDKTTYVITIGSKTCDKRRNQLKDSFMLSFSTGKNIENAKLEGKVIPGDFLTGKSENISGVDIVAYRLEGTSVTPDPRNDVPDYFIQSGLEGTYKMVGLSSGIYRLFAIGDKDRNGFYSEGYDLIGIAPHDIVLAEGDSIVYAPDIAISARDTSMVQLLSIVASNNRRVDLYFDREITPDSINIEFDGLSIIDWIIPFGNPRVISTYTEMQENGNQYTVKALTVMDRDKNQCYLPGIFPFFKGTDRPDTTALKIVDWQPKIIAPGSNHVTVIFNTILTLPDNSEEVLLPESTSEISVLKTGSNKLELVPKQKWHENENYQVVFNCEKLYSVTGSKLIETSSQLTFRVVSSDTLGFITGSIEDYTETAGGLYHLIFENIDTETVKELDVSGPVQWSTGPVLPGRYICRAFKDNDRDSKIFRGSIYPFKFAEQVFEYPDTVAVVSRWTNEDNIFIFR